MPERDVTDPLGRGPLTGRCLGPFGAGIRRRFGRYSCGCGGFVWKILSTSNKEDEKKILESELREIELEKHEVEKRLKELE